RNLSSAILKKYKYVTDELSNRFRGFSLQAISVDDLRTMRNSWNYAPMTALKRLEYVRTFFSFCVNSGWIPRNPAKNIKTPKVVGNPTAPFDAEEWKRILWAVDSYCEIHPESNIRIEKQLRAFVLLLRYSGLRISDACVLKRDRIDKNGRLF